MLTSTTIIVLLLLVLLPHTYSNPCSTHTTLSSSPFCNTSLPFAQRAQALISQLTLEEKVSQLLSQATALPRISLPAYQWWNEALHGIKALCTLSHCPTSFPMPINTAATFNKPLFQRLAHTISSEARALHHAKALGINSQPIGLDFWAPNINIFRDPRWGRGQETPGEDPFLSGQYALAFVRGMQGEDPVYWKTVATLKHFDGYSLEKWNGMDRFHFDARISDQDLYQTYLRAFKTAVEQGNVQSVMCSYNAVNGVPSCANAELFEVLRGEFGFSGYVVSDCDAVENIYTTHRYTKTPEQAAKDALEAGTDLDCGQFYGILGRAVEQGLVQESSLDTALERLFTARLRLGLFDPEEEQPFTKIPIEVVGSAPHRLLAREIAQQSIVLLKNENNLLPLVSVDENMVISIIGPHAISSTAMCGNYFGELGEITTPLTALRKRFPNSLYSPGCTIAGRSSAGFQEAIQAARNSSVTILFLGIDQSIESEGKDRYDMQLPQIQRDLFSEIAEVQDNIVVVLINGGPLDLLFLKQSPKAQSILEAFYPGEEGGEAIASVLTGEFNPSGRLPYTVYSPDYLDYISMEDMNMTTGLGRTYRFYRGAATYPFGHGLSYTSFEYALLHTLITPSDQTLTVNVTNSGPVDGNVSVLAFISYAGRHDGHCPIRQLFAFEHVFLQAQQSTALSFKVSMQDAGCFQGKQLLLFPGEYRVEINQLETRVSFDQLIR